MKIEEFYCMADENGEVLVPTQILEEMNIGAGDEIRIAYFADSRDNSNIFKELMLTTSGLATKSLDAMEREVGEFSIPGDLLAAANIPLDSDITITCVDGAVIISEAETFAVPDELTGLLEALGIPMENVSVTFGPDGGGEDE